MKKILLTAVALLWASAANAFLMNGKFNANSFVHTPLAPNAPLDPNSDAIVRALVEGTPSAWTLQSNGGAIYVVDCTVPTMQIKGERPWDPTFDQWGKTLLESVLSAVPMPPNFAPASATDAAGVIYRPCTNELWEGWNWHLTGGTVVNSAGQTVPQWGAAWGGRMPNVTTNPGYFVDGMGASATAIAQMGMTVTIEEQIRSLEQGGVALDHAIGFGFSYTSSDGFVFPAQRGDGWVAGGLVKEGMIFRFPASINFDGPVNGCADPQCHTHAVAVLPAYNKMIAKTIQKHGMVLVDTTGAGYTSIGLEGQGGVAYPGFTDVYNDHPNGIFQRWPPTSWFLGMPWDQLQVIQPPAR